MLLLLLLVRDQRSGLNRGHAGLVMIVSRPFVRARSVKAAEEWQWAVGSQLATEAIDAIDGNEWMTESKERMQYDTT